MQLDTRQLSERGASRAGPAAKPKGCEFREMTRPRAADDFAVIRARMEQPRRERAQISVAREVRPLCPPPYGRKGRGQEPVARVDTAEGDSPVEGDGFEPSVPQG